MDPPSSDFGAASTNCTNSREIWQGSVEPGDGSRLGLGPAKAVDCETKKLARRWLAQYSVRAAGSRNEHCGEQAAVFGEIEAGGREVASLRSNAPADNSGP